MTDYSDLSDVLNKWAVNKLMEDLKRDSYWERTRFLFRDESYFTKKLAAGTTRYLAWRLELGEPSIESLEKFVDACKQHPTCYIHTGCDDYGMYAEEYLERQMTTEEREALQKEYEEWKVWSAAHPVKTITWKRVKPFEEGGEIEPTVK